MFSSEVRYQVLAAICVNIISIGYGAVCGWTSPSLLILTSDETPLPTGPLNIDEKSWVTSSMCIGGFVGNIFFGWFAEKFGRKLSLIVLAFPQLIGWLLIIFATNPTFLYVARFLLGFTGGGGFVLIPLFISEISSDKIRGLLGSLVVLFCNIGYLIAFILGNYFSYLISPIVFSIIPIIYLIPMLFFPETPQYLLKIGNVEKAEESLCFYRNVKQESTHESNQIKNELDKLKMIYYFEKSNESSLKKSIKNDGIQLSDFTSPAARKAMLIGLGLVALNQFCGVFAMVNYTATIFKESGSSLTPNMAAIIVGAIQLAGAYMSTVLVERAGRKFMVSFSAAGTGCGLLCLSAHTYLKNNGYSMENFNWIPVVAFSFIIFIASWGVLTLPFVIISEIMPEKIKAMGTSICMSMLWIFAFIMIKGLPFLMLACGMDGLMLLFAGCSFSGALFILLCVPETKGKSFDEIMEMLK